jgi:CRISPR system Cascade subunit CasB
MSSFIAWLEGLSEKDTKVRAVLRRSLAFAPGMFVPSYPYVEPFLKDEDTPWRRRVFYLIAGLWAAHWRDVQEDPPLSIGKACANYQNNSGSTSAERRFITLLDSDSEQLPHRLRQMMRLLKDEPVDFEALTKGLLHWNDLQKRTQNAWARDFYRNLKHENNADHKND